MRYDLAQLARERGKRRTVALRPIAPRRSAELGLERIIRMVLAEGERSKALIMLSAEVTAARHTQDMGLGETFRGMRDAMARLIASARGMVDRLLRIEAVRHDDRWLESVNAAIGVDLKAVVQQRSVEPLIELATAAAVALITGLSDEVAKRVETAVIDMLTQGKSTRDIAKAFDAQFGFGKRRAKLIARDQAAKFNGNLNRIRQQEAGVTEYIWWTVHDERVRGNPEGRYPGAKPSHWARHGKTFRWDEPPSDGHPGQPINCRCIPRPVIRAE
ncbi:phage minor head protein [Alsobacter sp. KACC 23698]|uniref:Phage minor head protein n=1 Tax=Alsobacter sp. KACC 23698 TaxID=3149229 RepID=A0AAU7J8I7_9HYPH